MIESVPAAARSAPPDTGASMKAMSLLPIETSSAATDWAYDAGTVEQRRRVAFLGRAGIAGMG
jgi:hypothetical protein